MPFPCGQAAKFLARPYGKPVLAWFSETPRNFCWNSMESACMGTVCACPAGRGWAQCGNEGLPPPCGHAPLHSMPCACGFRTGSIGTPDSRHIGGQNLGLQCLRRRSDLKQLHPQRWPHEAGHSGSADAAGDISLGRCRQRSRMQCRRCSARVLQLWAVHSYARQSIRRRL